MDWTEFEKEKYKEIWSRGDYTSGSAKSIANYLADKVNGTVLEIGCGKGISIDLLSYVHGITCTGCDITLDGYDKDILAVEAPAWDLPFPDNSFNYSFSTDVLEHIPTECVEQTLREIGRVTKYRTYHYIATRPAITKYKGEQVHLTVKPLLWWKKQFEEFCPVDFILLNRVGNTFR